MSSLLLLLFFIFLLVNLIFPLEIFISVSLVLLLSYISKMNMISDPLYNYNLNQSYECGFEYMISGCGFSLQFYVVSFSFLLFDLEICLFIPLILSLYLAASSFFFFLVFCFLLFLFFYTNYHQELLIDKLQSSPFSSSKMG